MDQTVDDELYKIREITMNHHHHWVSWQERETERESVCVVCVCVHCKHLIR